MQTEELVRRGGTEDTRNVSPALQARMPEEWQLSNEKGHSVPLSAAGHVLFFHRTYELRVFPPPGATALVHAVNIPPFLVRKSDVASAKHGRAYHGIAFTVQRSLSVLQMFRWPYETHCGDLEIEYQPQSGAPARTLFKVPVVARTPWGWGILLLVLGGALAGWLLDCLTIVVQDCWTRRMWPWSEDADWSALATHPRVLFPLVLALLNPLAAAFMHVVCLRQRSRELEARYRASHVPPAAEQAGEEGW